MQSDAVEASAPLAERIVGLAKAQGARLGAPGAARLAAWIERLAEFARTRNVSGARTPEAMLGVLLVPSLPLARAFEDRRPPRRVVDVGSGNGFPGVVAAALWPGARVWLVERRERKAEALAAAAAGWPALEVLACDAREVPARRPDLVGRADLVTFRAVGPLEGCNRLARPLLAPGGRVVHWKPVRLAVAERREGARTAMAAGWHERRDVVPPPPATGRLVVYEAGPPLG